MVFLGHVSGDVDSSIFSSHGFLNLCFLSTFSCSGLARFCMTWVYFSCPPLLSLFLYFPRNWEFSWSSSLFLRVSLPRVPCSLFKARVIHSSVWFTRDSLWGEILDIGKRSFPTPYFPYSSLLFSFCHGLGSPLAVVTMSFGHVLPQDVPMGWIPILVFPETIM